MNSNKLLLLSTMILFSFGAFAQDYIYKKNREILKVKIEEVGTSEIKYKDFNNLEGPSYFIDKEKTSRIELENGDVLTFNKSTNSLEDPDYYTDDHLNDIKISFTSLFSNHLDIYYERSLSPTASVEGAIGIIGIGVTNTDEIDFSYPRNPGGVMLRAGYKFKRSPDYYLPKMRYGHILKGAYIKPEIVMSIYGEDYAEYNHATGSINESRESAFAGAFMLNIGKQWIFDNRFALDWFFGVGYGFTNSKNFPDSDYEGYSDQPGLSQYGFTTFPGFPIALSAGINIGYVFDWKKN